MPLARSRPQQYVGVDHAGVFMVRVVRRVQHLQRGSEDQVG